MIEPIEITDVKAQVAAVIHIIIPRSHMQSEMPVAIQAPGELS